ncbi:MAG: M56 family metallopeptidase, partial [Gemmatimonadaceae bacterium]
MIATFSAAVLAWLLTYLIHSTALLALAWGLTRARQWTPASADILWKAALLGGLLSATAQIGLELRPVGSVSLTHAAAITTSHDAAHIPAAPTSAQGNATGDGSASTSPAYTASPPESPAIAALATPLSMQTVIAAIWALGALALALGYVARRLILVGRIGDRRAVSDARLLAELEQLSADAKLRRRPRLTVTTRLSSPIALGISEICLPESALTELDPEEQRVMLAHELAHLARHDPIWLALASVVERVLWIQPLNRFARRRIAASSEYLCDEWAVRRTGSGVALARCLARVAEWIQTSPLGVPVAGMAEERSLLVSRVEKLLAGGRHDPRSRGLLALAAVGVVVATIAIVPGVTGRSARASEPYGMPDDPKPSLDSRSADPMPNTTEHVSLPEPRHARADTTVVLALIGRLKDEDADVRAAAAASLGKLEDSRAVPALIAALSDREAKVRAAAAQSLAQFTDPRAVNGLSALLSDAEADVRKEALDALTEYESGVPIAAIA